MGKRGDLSGSNQVIISNYDAARFLGEYLRDDDTIRFRPGVLVMVLLTNTLKLVRF